MDDFRTVRVPPKKCGWVWKPILRKDDLGDGDLGDGDLVVVAVAVVEEIDVVSNIGKTSERPLADGRWVALAAVVVLHVDDDEDVMEW